VEDSKLYRHISEHKHVCGNEFTKQMKGWEFTCAVKFISDEAIRTGAAVITWNVRTDSVLAAVSMVHSAFVNIYNFTKRNL